MKSDLLKEEKEFYRFKESPKVLCCNVDIPAGEVIQIFRISSKNRVLFVRQNNQIHKMKLSTFRRITEEIKVEK